MMCVVYRWGPFRQQLLPNPQCTHESLAFAFATLGYIVSVQAGSRYASSMIIEGLDLTFSGWLGIFDDFQLTQLFPREASTFQVRATLCDLCDCCPAC